VTVEIHGVNANRTRARVTAVLPSDETHVASVQLYAGPIIPLATIPLATMRWRIPLRPRVLAVTDRCLLLYTASWFRICQPKELIAALRPDVLARPHRNSFEWETTVDIDGETHWAHFAWRDDLAQVVEAAAVLGQNH